MNNMFDMSKMMNPFGFMQNMNGMNPFGMMMNCSPFQNQPDAGDTVNMNEVKSNGTANPQQSCFPFGNMCQMMQNSPWMNPQQMMQNSPWMNPQQMMQNSPWMNPQQWAQMMQNSPWMNPQQMMQNMNPVTAKQKMEKAVQEMNPQQMMQNMWTMFTAFMQAVASGMQGSQNEEQKKGFCFGGLTITPELLQKFMSMEASPKSLEMLQKFLEMLFEAYNKNQTKKANEAEAVEAEVVEE